MSDNQVIPEAAVEAAARALRESRLNGRQGLAWQSLDSRYRDEFRRGARAILEAAAPHMIAGSWDEGYEKGALSQFEEPRNPYRSTP